MSLQPVSPIRRFTAWALETVLIIGTAYIGWFVWSLITWGRGQTPAQNLLRIVSMNEKSGTPAMRPQMFIRYFLMFTAYWFGYFAIANVAYAISPSAIVLAVGITALIAFQIYDIASIFLRGDQRRLADVAAGIVVVDLEIRTNAPQ